MYDVWESEGNYFLVYRDDYWGDYYLEESAGGLWQLDAPSPRMTSLGLLWFHLESGGGYFLSGAGSGYLGSGVSWYDVYEYEPGSPYFSDGRRSIVSPLTGADMTFAQGFSSLGWLVDESIAFVDGKIMEWDGNSDWVDLLPGRTFWDVSTAPTHPARLFAATDAGSVTLFAYAGQGNNLTSVASQLAHVGQMFAASPSLTVLAVADSATGSELWVSDGTVAGTRLHADLRPGPIGSNPRKFQSSGSHVFFIADAPRPNTLWAMSINDFQWRRNPHNGHTYRLSSPGSWHAALAEAQAEGGNLATIRDQREQDWLWSQFGPDNLWIGLEDLDQNGQFEWTSGEPTNFATWCPGQPNGATQGETVVHMGNYPGWCTGPWNDQDPNDVYRGIIERIPPALPVMEIGSGCHGASATWNTGNPIPGDRLELSFDMGPTFGSGLMAALTDVANGLPSAVDLGALLGDPNLSGCDLYLRPSGLPAVFGTGAAMLVEWSLPPSLPPGFSLYVQGIGVSSSQRLSTTNLLRVQIR